jgi:hypothetical protein
MTPYRISRRSFLSGLGGAVGLKILLQNLEAAAEGASSPPRFLMTFWPTGTAKQRFLPTGGRTDFTISPILAPFEKAGLREDLIALFGLAHRNQTPGGGGSESGTVFSSTGADSEGTRSNGGEADDGVAGGPSFDQIFLKNSPLLARPGAGYANAICDARVDSLETSTQCLSYSYQRRQIQSANPGGLINENIPLLPTLAPAQLYAQLFAGFMPGAATQSNAYKSLMLRKSVLDSSLRELTRLRALAPSSERPKIDVHAAAIRAVEQQLQDQIAAGGNGQVCVVPQEPDRALVGKSGSKFDYADPTAPEADNVWLEQVGKLHLALIRVAFQCDLIRVATFQWCSATNHVAFSGMNPVDPITPYIHHPFLNLGGGVESAFWLGAPPAPSTSATSGYAVYEFACNVQTWFYQKTVDALVEFKNAKDAFGGSLLDYTVVPFITDEANNSDARSPLPALLVGGKKLGMVGGQYLNFTTAMPHNSMWLSVAQAFFPNQNPAEVLAQEPFMKAGPPTIIDGLWQKPT